MSTPRPGETYLHFKGRRYKVIAVGWHTETEEEMVVYSLFGYISDRVWIRPLSDWNKEADYFDPSTGCNRGPRFIKVS